MRVPVLAQLARYSGAAPFFRLSFAFLLQVCRQTHPPSLSHPSCPQTSSPPPSRSPTHHTPPLPPTDGQPRPSSRRSAKSEALSVRLEAMDRCAALLARFVEGPPAGEPRGEGVGQAGLGCEALDCICL